MLSRCPLALLPAGGCCAAPQHPPGSFSACRLPRLSFAPPPALTAPPPQGLLEMCGQRVRCSRASGKAIPGGEGGGVGGGGEDGAASAPSLAPGAQASTWA